MSNAPESFIPLSVPCVEGHEWSYVKDCLDTGWLSSAGPFVDRFEKEFAKYVGAKHAIACSSGTAALHISLQLAGVKAGDLVLVPTLTFIASVNAISYLGAEPFFLDSDDYYNLDISKLQKFFETEVEFRMGSSVHKKTGKRIAALVAVHVFGNAIDLSWAAEFCKQSGVPLIEDAAESVGTRYNNNAPVALRGKHTGTIGAMGCFSFNGNKIITTGGGGMIVTDDDALAKKAKYLTTQAKDDEVHFIHHEIGYNYRMTNVQAATGVAQLEKLEEYCQRKAKIYERYRAALKNVKGLKIADVPPFARNNYWMPCLQVNEKEYGESRDQLIERLGKEKIQARPVWYLNHQQKPFQHCQGFFLEKAPTLRTVTLNLPCSAGLSEQDQERVIKALIK